VKALYFGTYDREHPRNVNAIAAMRDAGIDVIERSANVHGTGLRGAASVLAAETRLLRPRGHDFDLVIVGYPGHFDVPQARRLARRKPLVFDAVLSLEDELVVVRRRFRPRSTAATVLRAVDLRALRLPDLVVCGTDAEARHLQSLGASHVASVFLGADEGLFRHAWSPVYPFGAVHFASGIAGDESGDVVRQAAGLTDVPTRVSVRGEVAPDDLGIAVAHAGIVLGSFRESRAIPPAVFDALATGAPVVTAGTDAARELLVDGESALLVRPNDPPAVAAAVTRLAGDEELRRRMAAAGRMVFAARASRPVLGERWRGLLDELVVAAGRP
jgi:glycosyltransferase involved in cell wall biosynthesis